MLTVHDCSPAVIVEALGQAPVLSAELEAEVNRLWFREQERRGKALFDGQILSASEIGPTRITGHVVGYRRLIAQRARPDLFVMLFVRPVAVTGLLHCADGTVFGLRAASVTEAAGMWELVPSGGLDTSHVEGAPLTDIRGQILTELREEIGLMPEQVAETAPFCLIDDLNSHVVDIGFRLEAPDILADCVLQAYRQRGSDEYSELAIVADAHLAEFMERKSPSVLPVSQMMLREYRRG